MVHAVIGDIVGSRQASDQRHLLEDLAAELEWVNSQVEAVQALAPTIGDEFQGVYSSLRAALDATLLLRLRRFVAKPDLPAGLRFGIGEGEVVQAPVAEPPYGQSGTAWWKAREAIDRIEANAARNRWPRSAQTAFAGSDAAFESAVNAFLLTRDALLARADRSDARICLGLFLGESQREVAEDLGVTQPAVAQRSADKGWHAVWQAHALFGGES
jgi:SatD family (SatD)